MIRRDQIVATTHVDLHRERLALSALESLVEMANASYVPVILEHDPRCPPLGRVVNARIDALPDGQHAVVSTYEIFEPGDCIESVQGRVIPLRAYGGGRIQLCFDRTYRDSEAQELIREISDLLASEPQEEGKKALEPLSVLTIGAAVRIGAIATGFLNALGAEAYTAVKSKLKKLVVPHRGGATEHLLRFELAVSDDSTLVNVDAIFTNPTPQDVDYALGRMLQDLDELLPGLLSQNQDIRRIVFEAGHDRIRLSFAVRWEAVPLSAASFSGVVKPPDAGPDTGARSSEVDEAR